MPNDSLALAKHLHKKRTDRDLPVNDALTTVFAVIDHQNGIRDQAYADLRQEMHKLQTASVDE